MASLYKRATPSQERILRVVEGAVKNVMDFHPEVKISPRNVRSIAKRAAGTLTAQWPDVLAAREFASSDEWRALTLLSATDLVSKITKMPAWMASQLNRRHPLLILRGQIRHMMRGIKDSGNDERAKAMIDVLKMIHELEPFC